MLFRSVYLAENGLLILSVRLFGAPIERGTYESSGDGHWHTAPYEHTRFTGLLDLLERDAFLLFRNGSVAVTAFRAPENEYCYFIEPAESLEVRETDVFVRREERDRIEQTHGLGRRETAEKIEDFVPFRQSNDYREVRLGAEVFRFGPVQASVVKALYEAAGSSHPWCEGKALLATAGSASARMADVFKSQLHWREIIESDGRGRYRLRLSAKG